MKPFRVRSFRGDVEETTHDAHVAVVELGAGSSARWATRGDPDLATLTRSAAKPFQAMPLFDGALERFDIDYRELALCCSSHNSERSQVDLVGEFLARLGLPESALACGPHVSLIRSVGYHLTDGGDDPELAACSRLASNCSGKHAGMLATALAGGFDVEGYERPSHAVQGGCRAAISRMTDVPEQDILAAPDGCGVVSWGVPLRALALAYGRLGRQQGDIERELVRAMIEYPELVAGHRRLGTALMRAYPGEVIAKLGAAGVFAAALPGRGVGIAIKVSDGNVFAAGVVLLAVLDGLDLLDAVPDRLPDYWVPAILDTRHQVVGRYEAADVLQWEDSSWR